MTIQNINNIQTNVRSGSAGQSQQNTSVHSQISDEFITLLSAQLMNQDPTNPMESHEVTAQLAQIASLEQQEGTNKLMQGLIGMVGTLGNYSALNTVGKDATVLLDKFIYDGKSPISGELVIDNANKSEKFTVEIKDEAGLTIKEIEVNVVDGKAKWEWDGTNSKGEKVVEGNYQISAHQNIDNDGTIEKVDVAVTTEATITSVSFLFGLITMSNGIEVPFGNIISVAEKEAEEKPTPDPLPTPETEI